MEEAIRYLATLKINQWHNINDSPAKIRDNVWEAIEQGLLDGYRFMMHESIDYLVMKTRNAEDADLKMTLAQIERDYQSIDWLWCKFAEEGHIMEITGGADPNASQRSTIKVTSDPIFKELVGKSLIDVEVLNFLYRNCKTIKIVYTRKEDEPKL